MDLGKFKAKLDKINRYYEYISEDGQISNIERDAMMMYIRELYDLFFEQEGDNDKPKPPTQKKMVTTPPTPPPTESTKKTPKKRPKLVFNTTTEETPKKEEKPKEEPKVEEKKEEKAPPKVEEKKAPEPPKKEQEPKPEPPKAKEEPKKETPKKEEKKPEPPQESEQSSEANEDYEELFTFKEATDLSQKLSASPIEDLSKALGLNEKFLFINELFGGDVSKFKEAIDHFNKPLDSFDEVRQHIENNLIEPFEWLSKTKKAVAKDFIKLIRRRYL